MSGTWRFVVADDLAGLSQLADLEGIYYLQTPDPDGSGRAARTAWLERLVKEINEARHAAGH